MPICLSANCTNGSIRVVNTESYNSSFGRVEVCNNEMWTTVCAQFWDNQDATVTCRQLGYSPYGTSRLR